MIVIKFGGTSVGDAQRVANAIDIVAERRDRDPIVVVSAPIRISAQTNRVPTIDGHLMTISMKLRRRASRDEIIEALREFRGEPQELNLPSAPAQPIHYIDAPDRPQPRLDRDRENGMSVSIGRLRPCTILDYRMVALVHNTIRGAAGAALLNAELLEAKGLL